MTRRRRIPGLVDYRLLAQLHRPQAPELLAREARHLLGQGLTLQDAAEAFRVPPRALADLLHHHHQDVLQ